MASYNKLIISQIFFNYITINLYLIFNLNFNTNNKLNNIFCFSKELKHLFIIKRHGADSPDRGFSNNFDIYNEKWLYPGELTAIGHRSDFLLGKKIKEKYKNFIGEEYNINAWDIHSTDYNKTIVSTNAFMYGIYPKYNNNNKKVNIPSNLMYPEYLNKYLLANKDTLDMQDKLVSYNYYPNKVYSRYNKLNFFYYGFSMCKPIISVIEDNLKNLKKLKDIMINFKSKYGDKLKKALKWKDDNALNDFNIVFILVDTFVSDYINGKSLDLLKDNDIDLEEFYKYCINFYREVLYSYYNGDENKILSRISASIMLPHITKNFNNTIENDYLTTTNDNNNKTFKYNKVTVITVNDINIASILSYFDLVFEGKGYYNEEYNQNCKENLKFDILYSSNIIIELNYNKKRNNKSEENALLDNNKYIDYTVSIYMDDNLIIPDLKYDNFKVDIKSKYFEESKIIDFCYDSNSEINTEYQKGTIILAIIFGVLLILFIISLLICNLCCIIK